MIEVIERYGKFITLGAFLVVGVGLIAWQAMLPVSDPTAGAEDSTMETDILCMVDAVALHQHLFEFQENGGEIDKPVFESFLAHFDDITKRQRRYQQNNDGTYGPAFRQAMISAERSRDTEITADAAAYREAALERVAICTPLLTTSYRAPLEKRML